MATPVGQPVSPFDIILELVTARLCGPIINSRDNL